jgi:rubrerythrin
MAIRIDDRFGADLRGVAMKRPINPVFPVQEVRDVDELMDIATAMEREAANRYGELVIEMERRGNEDVAALFRELREDELRHEDEIARWAARTGGRAPRPVAYRWRMPESFDMQEADGRGDTLTPYRALGIALRNEETAFSFYAYLSAIAETEAVRARADALAQGELEHVARLRARRRKALGAERQPRRRVASVAELRRLARGLARGSAELDAAMAGVLEAAGDVASAAVLGRTAQEALPGAGATVTDADAGEPLASEALQAAKALGLLEAGTLTAEGALRLCLRDADEVLQTYLDLAERAQDEAVMREAQRLGERAVARLALISAQLQAAAERA